MIYQTQKILKNATQKNYQKIKVLMKNKHIFRLHEKTYDKTFFV